MVLFFVYPVIIYYLNCFTMFGDLPDTKIPLTLANIFFLELFLILLFMICNKAKTAVRIELILMWFLGLANAYVYRFRRSYIRPWDLTSLGTAANVASNYDYTPALHMAISFCIMLVLFVLASFCKPEADKLFGEKKMPRVVFGLLAAGLISLMTVMMQKDVMKDALGIYTIFFDSKGMMKKNGMAVNFMYQMKYLKVEKPAGYDPHTQEEILASYGSSEKAPEHMPDIMVFMDEAFSDPKVDGDFSVNEDYMPFVHSLMEGSENTISGYINVSVNGGNTPNTEFEFLTGNTLGFLPEGCIAFQQYVRREMDSIPFYLSSLGYQTFASHPYKASGWDRPKAWKLLGFDELLFKEYFEERDPMLVRNYISDDSHFQMVSDKMDEMNAAGPVFSFNVTMQNHSGYSKDEYDNFERKILVDASKESDRLIEMENYLSLIKYSDEAFEKVVKRYEDSDRDMMIVFFGDHQPEAAVFDEMWDENGKYWDDLSEEDYVNTYRVPFVIWANFDIDEMTGVETSVNYLGDLVLKEAGFDLPAYRKFLQEQAAEYPVVSAVRYVDKNGNSVMQNNWGDELLDYQRMQYYEMFDDMDHGDGVSGP